MGRQHGPLASLELRAPLLKVVHNGVILSLQGSRIRDPYYMGPDDLLWI